MNDLNAQRFKRLQTQLLDAERILNGKPNAIELTGLLEEVDSTWKFCMPGMLLAAEAKEDVQPWVDLFAGLRLAVGKAIYLRNHL
jgi:hypothetical protein